MPTNPNMQPITLRVKPEFHKQIKQHCKDLGWPMTVWIISLIQKELASCQRQKPLD